MGTQNMIVAVEMMRGGQVWFNFEDKASWMSWCPEGGCERKMSRMAQG